MDYLANLLWNRDTWIGLLMLIPFAGISYLQNMAFTWSSRTRQGENLEEHRKAALASNGAYYINNFVQTAIVVKYLTNPIVLVASFVVYMSMTAQGSVSMMRKMIEARKQMDAELAERQYQPQAPVPSEMAAEAAEVEG